MSSADYRHPDLNTELVQSLYDQIFFGHANECSRRIPFGFASVPLNGTQPLPPDIDADAPVEIDWQFGVFPDPYARVVNYIACLVTGTASKSTYSKLLSSIQKLAIDDDHEDAAMSSMEGPVLATQLRRRYTEKFDVCVPVALVTGWHFGTDGEQNENISMHLPKIAHPGSMLTFLRSVAVDEENITQQEKLAPIKRLKPSRRDVEIFSACARLTCGPQDTPHTCLVNGYHIVDAAQYTLAAAVQVFPTKDGETLYTRQPEDTDMTISDTAIFEEFFKKPRKP